MDELALRKVALAMVDTPPLIPSPHSQRQRPAAAAQARAAVELSDGEEFHSAVEDGGGGRWRSSGGGGGGGGGP